MNEIVICHTTDCENCDVPIKVVDALPTVICGGCNVEITDKVKA